MMRTGSCDLFFSISRMELFKKLINILLRHVIHIKSNLPEPSIKRPPLLRDPIFISPGLTL